MNLWADRGVITLSVIFFFAFLFTLLVLPRLASIASRIGLVDLPSRRKAHHGPKPLVGGVGMMMALCLTCLMFLPLYSFRGVFAGLVLLVIVGFLDDFRELDHKVKFAAQVMAVLFMVYFSKTRLLGFGDLLMVGDLNFGRMSVILTIVGVVGVINAMNMIDGLDGLSTGVSIVAFLAFGILSYMLRQFNLIVFATAFIGVLAGFLRYNYPPASMFMGDAGSMCLGFALGYMSVAVTQIDPGVVPPVMALLIMAVPISDTLLVMSLRLFKGRSPFYADRTHLHHILIRLGMSKAGAMKAIVGISALFSALAIAGVVFKLPEHVLFAVFVVYFALSAVAAMNMKKIMRRALGKYRQRPASQA